MSRRIAVVLFNLGGPDNPDAIRPFLFNLFADPAIIRVPNPARLILAWAIAKKRTNLAKDIYAEIGGGSPLLPNTEAQARALEAQLADLGEVKAFIAMRYWHPMSQETAMLVKDFAPDEVILLPLYPQFSTTTTASSVRVWRDACKIARLDVPTRLVCCYPTESRFIAAMAAGLRAAHEEAARYGRPRVLFSAHGLPEKIVKAGDPYQWQCERTAAALAEASGIPDLDWVSTYQSRVGRLKWIEPSTEAVIHQAALEKRPIVVVPIAFVSEHSETLVELDIEYRRLADESGAPCYLRVPTVGAEDGFIAGLADLVRAGHRRGTACEAGDGGRICPAAFTGCPSKAA
ncbi:ferrochelatase [Inquilinus limosus]|uniref:Ferrochelatase n=1 Tax=Inquilinus limosus TaxID=171674 RepID=A0A211ZLW2_9PROT|nr:ferrochelatase [Inquilinus limosus]OWJ66268.1 ferrochelatase [Inquilinus limosus]